MICNIPEFSISLKNKATISDLPVIKTAESAAAIARECFDADTFEWAESMIVIALNNAGRVLGFYKASQGGITATIVDPRIVFQFALLSNATAIILSHNHPSGTLKPSRQDEILTQKMVEAGRIMEIKVNDHIIISEGGYYSFAENGQI